MTISPYAIPGLKEERKSLMPSNAKAERIIEKVCRYFELNEMQTRSTTRRREYATARKWAMYFIRKQTDLSLCQIAEMFSGRDHTTAIHSIDFIKEQLSAKTPNTFKDDYENLIQII